MRKCPFVPSLVCAIGLIAPAPVVADYYDEFNDGEWAQDPNDPNIFDPNLWDIDNPHWALYGEGHQMGEVFAASASTGALWLYVDAGFLPETWFDAQADDDDGDPNTSATYFDNSGPHYMVAYVIIVEPNTGLADLRMYDDLLLWTAYAFDYIPSYQGGNAHTAILSYNGLARTVGPNEYRTDIDANGFWMALQYDTNASAEPNDHSVRAATWNGDKFDWDGQWDLAASVTWFLPDSCSEGRYSVAARGDLYNGLRADMAFDNIESCWGTFSNVFRTLTLKKKDCTIVLDPNLPHPAGGDLRRYTNGTVLCLQAEPIGNKAFSKWKINGPNQSGDPAYQEITDTNAVLYLTMDGDYWVKGIAKCGGGSTEPFAGIVLSVLGLAVLVRRLS